MTRGDKGIRTYVLRQGRMTEAQRRALEGEGLRFLLPFEQSPLDFAQVFGNALPVIVEIGFGMGQATWKIAEAQPESNFLGIEVHRPGVGKLLAELVTHSLGNVRIINHDAIEVLERMIPPASLEGIHLFFPDPWPKKKHHKRRLVRPGLAELMASRLRTGGYLYFVTDIEEYATSALEVLSATPGLRNRYEAWSPPQAWRPETKFEARANGAGRSSWALIFDRP